MVSMGTEGSGRVQTGRLETTKRSETNESRTVTSDLDDGG